MDLHHSSIGQLHNYFYTHNFMQQSALEKKDFPSILLFLVFGVCIPKVFPSAHNHDDVMLAMGTGGGGEKEATLRF